MAKSEFASDVTRGRLLTIWWAYLWRTVIYSMLLGFILGFSGGVIVGVVGRPDLGGSIGALLGSLGSIPVSLVVMSIVLKKRYTSFSIRLVPHSSASEPAA
jgi:uncharacterized membrane protein